MKPRLVLYSVLAASLIFSLYVIRAEAQRPACHLVLYDDFNQRFLDPSKWTHSGSWFGSALDAVREIQQGGLRLAVRSYGTTDSNSGNQVAQDDLHFANPDSMKGIAATFKFRQVTLGTCPANPDTQAVQNLIAGNFFNSGSTDPNDDLTAFLDIEHSSADPEGQLTALGFMSWQGQFFGGVAFGNPHVGQTVVAQLAWDQPNHQFILTWTDVDTGKSTQGFMPYTGISDSAPAVNPDKRIGVDVFAPNCIGTHMLPAYGDSLVQNVWVGK